MGAPPGRGRPTRPGLRRNTVPMGPRKGVLRGPNTPPNAAPASYPGVPAVTAPKLNAPAPRTAASEIMRANAGQGLGLAQNNWRDQVFQAAMGLGDENIFNQLKADPQFAGYQFAVDPNSIMATLGRQEQEGLKSVDEERNAGNTFFSGLRLNDRNDLSSDFSRQRSGALGDYGKALTEYARALAGSQGKYNQGMGDADIYDIDYALQFNPEPGPQAPVKPKKPKKKPPKRGRGRG